MKHFFLLVLALSFSLAAFPQQKQVQGSIATKDSADLSILQVLPDSFPNVSVVFKAETRAGEPVWGLTKEAMTVKENGQDCAVISIDPVSKNQAIHLGIVFDHSGSMAYDSTLFYDVSGQIRDVPDDERGLPVYPKGYLPPIKHAKNAVKTFVQTFDNEKDDISIIGFSDRVDKVLPLSHDLKQINAMVDGMEADYSTAFYDALMVGMDEVMKADGLRVLVALTDGQDNSSTATLKKVIAKAKRLEIPIYVVGLGDVNKPDLKRLAKESGGRFFHTKSGSALKDVYALISKQLQAFYSLVYASPNFSAADSTREVYLDFEMPGIALHSTPDTIALPQSVLDHLATMETNKTMEYLLYGGIATAVAVGAFGILLGFRRRARKAQTPAQAQAPRILKVYPNPSDGHLTVESTGEPSLVEVMDAQGRLVLSTSISGKAQPLDLSMLPDGPYIAYLQANGMRSNGAKLLIRK